MKNSFKKILALLLALSMLSSLPMVSLAAEETGTTAEQTVYDLAEAYAIQDGYTFTAGNAVADYQNLPAAYTNDVNATPWKIGYFTLSASDNTYSPLPNLNRVDEWSRVPEDTVNTDWYIRPAFGEQEKGQPSGGQYNSAKHVGYAFGSDTNKSVNSFSGSHSSKQRTTVRFVIPRDGVVNPVLRLSDDATEFATNNDGVLFRLYKVSGNETTPIYGGDFTATLDQSSGWERIPAGNVLTTWDSEKVPVKAGDELVLIFDPNVDHYGDNFCLNKYVIHYLDPIKAYDGDIYVTYTEGKDNLVDLTRRPIVEGDTATINYTVTDLDTPLLEETSDGIYRLTGETNYDGTTLGTPVKVTASYTPAGSTEVAYTTTTNLYVSTVKNVYDIGEAFEIKPYTFTTADNIVADYNAIEPKYENSETSTFPWKIGYMTGSAWEFKYYTAFNRSTTYDRVIEDTVNTTKALRVGYGKSESATNGSLNTTFFGYCYKSDNASGHGFNSISGYQTYPDRPTIRFVVPRDGVINPVLKLADNDSANNGVLFKVYKKSGDSVTAIYEGTETSGLDQSGNWILIPRGNVLTAWDTAKVAVKQGDEIILQIDANGDQSGDEYNFHTYVMNYLDPIVDYSSDIYGYYDADSGNLLDLTVDKTLTTDEGSVEYKLLDNDGILTETATPGVYTMTGEQNLDGYVKETPVRVIASYYPAGKSSANGDISSYTTTAEVYVGAAKDLYDFGEAFTPADGTDFTSATVYQEFPLKYANSDESASPWKAGLTEMSTGEFTYLTHVSRYADWTRHPDDGTSTKTVGMAFGTGIDESNYITGPRIGYSFDQNTSDNMTPGTTGKYRSTLRFIVPRDGVVHPKLSLYDANRSSFDGVFFKVYKKSGDSITAIYSDASSSDGWINIPSATEAIYDTEKVSVSAGDEIVLMFDMGTDTHADEMTLRSYQIEYIEPISGYSEFTDAVYDPNGNDNTLDLRVTMNVSDGSVEYTTDDKGDLLTETDEDGVYTLTGSNWDGTAFFGEPVTVTASYYAAGESSANGNAPVCTITTTVRIESVYAATVPFGYYTVQTTNLDMAYDTFFLPYYPYEAERDTYGSIDLKLDERWAGATVTFDQEGYLEYADGHIKATGLYDHTKSNPGTVDSTDIKADTTIAAKRDENTVGTPIKMTVTAPDGFTKHYYVLTFKARVQDIEQDGHDVYRWIYGSYKGDVQSGATIGERSSNRINNAVMGFEAVYGSNNNYTFSPMVPDPGNLESGNLIALEAAGNKYGSAASGAQVTPYNKLSLSRFSEAWNLEKFGNHIGAVGVAQTFTAPKTGTIELTDFVPSMSGAWQLYHMTGKVATVYVKLYDEDDTLIDTIYQETMTPKAHTDANTPSRWQFNDDATYGDTNYISGSRTAGKLIFTVEKGQKVRVFAEYPDMSGFQSWGWSSPIEFERNTDPIFTYVESELENTISATTDADTGAVTSSASATIAPVLDGGTYAYFGYDKDGKLVGSGYAALEAGAATVAPAVTGSAAVDYFKVFIWSDLNTLKSIGGALILR